MRWWLAVVLFGCGSHAQPAHWERRQGSGFTVEAPAAGTQLDVAQTAGPMTIFEYTNDPAYSLQVQIAELPKDLPAMQAIVNMRDHIAGKAHVDKEADVAIGDAPGKDLRYTTDLPVVGKSAIHERILAQGQHVYQVMFAHPVAQTAHDGDGDRFVESFALTGPKLDANAALQAALGSGSQVYQVAAGTPDPDGWYTFHSTRGGFVVRFPAPYSEASGDLGSDGQIYTVAAVRMPDRVKFTVTCMTGTPKTPDEMFAAVQSGSNVVSKRELQLGGHRAVEVRVPRELTLTVLLAARTCILSASPFSQTAPVPEADGHKFLDSFKPD